MFLLQLKIWQNLKELADFDMKKEKIVEIVWFVILLALFILSFILLKNGVLQERLASFGIWAPLILVILKMSTLIIAPLGGVPLYVLSGALFGSFKGFLLCFLGDFLGSVVCFFIGRRYGQRLVKLFVGENFFQKIKKFTNLLGSTKSYLKARIAVVNVPEILAYAAGLSPINFWKFVILHMPLYIVVDIPLVFLGSQIANFTAKYALVAFVLALLVSGVGFFFLYKDYQKAEASE